jgi:hypothetical protein
MRLFETPFHRENPNKTFPDPYEESPYTNPKFGLYLAARIGIPIKKPPTTHASGAKALCSQFG